MAFQSTFIKKMDWYKESFNNNLLTNEQRIRILNLLPKKEKDKFIDNRDVETSGCRQDKQISKLNKILNYYMLMYFEFYNN